MNENYPQAKQFDYVVSTDETTDESLQPSKRRNRGVSDNSILDEAKEIIEGRSETHGEPEDSFSAIADYWNTYLEHEEKLYEEVDEEDVAELLALFKLARSHNGEHNRDDRRDRVGYVDLAEQQHNS